mgnify:CR=1 FL=1
MSDSKDTWPAGVAFVRSALMQPCPVGADLEQPHMRGMRVQQGHLFHMACRLLEIDHPGGFTFDQAADQGTLLAYGMALGLLAPEFARRLLELDQHALEEEWGRPVYDVGSWYESECQKMTGGGGSNG